MSVRSGIRPVKQGGQHAIDLHGGRIEIGKSGPEPSEVVDCVERRAGVRQKPADLREADHVLQPKSLQRPSSSRFSDIQAATLPGRQNALSRSEIRFLPLTSRDGWVSSADTRHVGANVAFTDCGGLSVLSASRIASRRWRTAVDGDKAGAVPGPVGSDLIPWFEAPSPLGAPAIEVTLGDGL